MAILSTNKELIKITSYRNSNREQLIYDFLLNEKYSKSFDNIIHRTFKAMFYPELTYDEYSKNSVFYDFSSSSFYIYVPNFKGAISQIDNGIYELSDEAASISACIITFNNEARYMAKNQNFDMQSRLFFLSRQLQMLILSHPEYYSIKRYITTFVTTVH